MVLEDTEFIPGSPLGIVGGSEAASSGPLPDGSRCPGGESPPSPAAPRAPTQKWSVISLECATLDCATAKAQSSTRHWAQSSWTRSVSAWHSHFPLVEKDCFNQKRLEVGCLKCAAHSTLPGASAHKARRLRCPFLGRYPIIWEAKHMPTMNSPGGAGISIQPERTQKNQGTKCPRRGLELFRVRSYQALVEWSQKRGTGGVHSVHSRIFRNFRHSFCFCIAAMIRVHMERMDGKRAPLAGRPFFTCRPKKVDKVSRLRAETRESYGKTS